MFWEVNVLNLYLYNGTFNTTCRVYICLIICSEKICDYNHDYNCNHENFINYDYNYNYMEWTTSDYDCNYDYTGQGSSDYDCNYDYTVRVWIIMITITV